MSDPEQVVFLMVMAFAGLAAILAVGAGLYDDTLPDGSTAPRPRARSPEDTPAAPAAGTGAPEAAAAAPATRADAPRKERPVLLSVSAGDAEFEPAKVQNGALRTRFTVRSDEVELKGSFQVDIVGGDDALLKQRIVRYRPLLLAILKRALRSGPAVRSAPPVVSSLKPVAGASEISLLESDEGLLATFAGDTLVAACTRAGKPALLAWTDLDGSPKPLFDAGEHRVLAMSPSPDGARIAVVLGAVPRSGTGSLDPFARLVAVDAVSGASRTLLEAGETFRFHVSPQIAWSAAADRLAIEGVTPSGRSVRILDPATGAPVGETGPIGATLVGWERDDRDAVILDKDGWHRWRPGGALEKIHVPYMMSPDTRFMLVVREVPVEEGGERVPDLDVVRRDQGAWTPMEGEEPDELARDMLLKDVLEHRVKWIGDHGALMYAPDPVVLDLASLASRYLVPPMPGATFVGASPKGRVVVRDADGRLHWGMAAAWA